MEEKEVVSETPIEEKKWKRSPRYVRKGVAVGCDICHSLRGTMRVYNGKRLCENCYKYAMNSQNQR